MRPSILSFSFILILLTFSIQLQAQRYATKSGHVSFFSETPLEKIESHNRQVNSALDLSTGDFVFRLLMKSFQFEKALMQEHFNENYVESDKFPNAAFKGKVTNISGFSPSLKGEYKAAVEGELTIHGVTKQIKETGTLKWNGESIVGEATFHVKPADYDIKIPGAVVKNIAESIQVTVKVDLAVIK